MKSALLFLTALMMTCCFAVEPQPKWACPDCGCTEESPCGCSKEEGCKCLKSDKCQCGPECHSFS